MAASARIFISHSSDDAELADAVAAALQAASAQVLIDRSGLEPGRPWRRDLHEWMARCTAGVVLLTPAVLARHQWVLKEAIILGWRLDLERDFRLMFALAPGVAREAFVAKGFGLAQLGEPQELQTPADAARAAALAAELAAVLPAQAAPTPFDDLAESLATLLQLADPTGATYPALAAQLGLVTPAAWGPDRHTMLAELLARAIVRGRDETIAVNELVKALAPWPREQRTKFVELLRPYWVDAQAAAMLLHRARAAGSAGGAGAVVIAGDAVPEFTAETYARRAYATALDRFQMAGAVSLEGGDPYDEIRAELCRYARAEGWVLRSIRDDAVVVNKLRGLPFAIVAPLTTLPDPPTIERLRADFPTVVFVAPRPQGLADDALDALELLPAPSREREGREYQQYRLALNAIRNL